MDICRRQRKVYILKSFLVKGKKPVIKWGMLPDNTFFKGVVPKGFSLAVCPSDGYVIVDVDRHDVDGFKHIPNNIKTELDKTLNYNTKNNGKHFWVKYTGNTNLANKSSNKGIDLRTSKGYVVWYPETDVNELIKDVNNSSSELNHWLEDMFGFKK